jgi:asparagine synthase (glutamine-hydrolysing)
VGHAAQTWRDEFVGSRHSFTAFKQVPWHHHGRYTVERSQLTLRSPFLDNRLVALAYRVPPEQATSPDPLLALISAGNSALSTVRTDRSLTTGRPTLLNRLARGWGEFSARAEYACDYGMPPGLARVDRFLRVTRWQNLFLGRHKFYHFRTWYRDALAPFVKSVLLDRRSLDRPWWDARKLERMVLDHTRGAANHTLDLHKVLTCELTHRELLEQP